MTTVDLLDPAVVLEANDEAGLELLLGWTSDRRVRLGVNAWLRVAEDYGDVLVLPKGQDDDSGYERDDEQRPSPVVGDIDDEEPDPRIREKTG